MPLKPNANKYATAPSCLCQFYSVTQMRNHMFDTLTAEDKSTLNAHLTSKLEALNLPLNTVEVFYDARNLPCPMPLLKAKATLRHVTDNQALYLIATDQHSQKDLVTYCNKNALIVHTWHSHDLTNETPIYHFIIIKPVN